MENKYNIDDVNAWLKEEQGMSYEELSKEFNKAVDLLSESLKQRKEMRDKINEAIEYLGRYYIFDDQNGEYYQTHDFDKCNAKELYDILRKE
jgi:hypothetical protein